MDKIIANPSLSLFQKILLTTDGSITELLSLYTNQSIQAKVIFQSIEKGKLPGDSSSQSKDSTLLNREVMLTDSSKNYIFAESSFLINKLSKTMKHKLLHTETPIGLLWKEERLEIFKEVIDIRLEKCETTASHFGLEPNTEILSRTYQLYNSKELFGVITEKFPTIIF
ncbi:DUF98 domain-containing protein [Endozoicomonas sp. SM1973]|uniref:DUF98 domain-containing protein n=1 Tax=Spartinivicinus marinus TaxID=2994442 RepID=A0A853I848_9GAMM|nr:chorismate pyruvate-lyase family protein [Spartinivicinus marinus]MCX4030106.1 chorismate pyruvate-lyase family protein [Spartinivicinus marinus]NYZ69493.1 DUF98 domain-containing protein [Spartinivicinus marinus]